MLFRSEIGNAELQKYHYKALRDDPEYLMDFKLGILREELMMQMPRMPDISGIEQRLEQLERDMAELKGRKVIYRYYQLLIGKPDRQQWI